MYFNFHKEISKNYPSYMAWNFQLRKFCQGDSINWSTMHRDFNFTKFNYQSYFSSSTTFWNRNLSVVPIHDWKSIVPQMTHKQREFKKRLKSRWQEGTMGTVSRRAKVSNWNDRMAIAYLRVENYEQFLRGMHRMKYTNTKNNVPLLML